MIGESPVVKALAVEDGLRIRVRICPDQLLFQPLQTCATSKERIRLLLSLALQGYLLQTGAVHGGSQMMAMPPLTGRGVNVREHLVASPVPRSETVAAAQWAIPSGAPQSPQGSPVSEFAAVLGGLLSDEQF